MPLRQSRLSRVLVSIGCRWYTHACMCRYYVWVEVLDRTITLKAASQLSARVVGSVAAVSAQVAVAECV